MGIIGVQGGCPAARCCIVTVEEIVDDLDAPPNACILPSWVITAICVVPGGAFPSYAHGYYERDNAAYIEWDAIAKTAILSRTGLERMFWRLGILPIRTKGRREQSDANGNHDHRRLATVAKSIYLLIGIFDGGKSCPVTHVRDCPIYESGTIKQASVLPLSIGDGELAETADAAVSREIFAYWLQGGRVDVGFLGAAHDRFANLNSTLLAIMAIQSSPARRVGRNR